MSAPIAGRRRGQVNTSEAGGNTLLFPSSGGGPGVESDGLDWLSIGESTTNRQKEGGGLGGGRAPLTFTTPSGVPSSAETNSTYTFLPLPSDNSAPAAGRRSRLTGAGTQGSNAAVAAPFLEGDTGGRNIGVTDGGAGRSTSPTLDFLDMLDNDVSPPPRHGGGGQGRGAVATNMADKSPAGGLSRGPMGGGGGGGGVGATSLPSAGGLPWEMGDGTASRMVPTAESRLPFEVGPLPPSRPAITNNASSFAWEQEQKEKKALLDELEQLKRDEAKVKESVEALEKGTHEEWDVVNRLKAELDKYKEELSTADSRLKELETAQEKKSLEETLSLAKADAERETAAMISALTAQLVATRVSLEEAVQQQTHATSIQRTLVKEMTERVAAGPHTGVMTILETRLQELMREMRRDFSFYVKPLLARVVQEKSAEAHRQRTEILAAGSRRRWESFLAFRDAQHAAREAFKKQQAEKNRNEMDHIWVMMQSQWEKENTRREERVHTALAGFQAAILETSKHQVGVLEDTLKTHLRESREALRALERQQQRERQQWSEKLRRELHVFQQRAQAERRSFLSTRFDPTERWGRSRGLSPPPMDAREAIGKEEDEAAEHPTTPPLSATSMRNGRGDGAIARFPLTATPFLSSSSSSPIASVRRVGEITASVALMEKRLRDIHYTIRVHQQDMWQRSGGRNANSERGGYRVGGMLGSAPCRTPVPSSSSVAPSRSPFAFGSLGSPRRTTLVEIWQGDTDEEEKEEDPWKRMWGSTAKRMAHLASSEESSGKRIWRARLEKFREKQKRVHELWRSLQSKILPGVEEAKHLLHQRIDSIKEHIQAMQHKTREKHRVLLSLQASTEETRKTWERVARHQLAGVARRRPPSGMYEDGGSATPMMERKGMGNDGTSPFSCPPVTTVLPSPDGVHLQCLQRVIKKGKGIMHGQQQLRALRCQFLYSLGGQVGQLDRHLHHVFHHMNEVLSMYEYLRGIEGHAASSASLMIAAHQEYDVAKQEMAAEVRELEELRKGLENRIEWVLGETKKKSEGERREVVTMEKGGESEREAERLPTAHLKLLEAIQQWERAAGGACRIEERGMEKKEHKAGPTGPDEGWQGPTPKREGDDTMELREGARLHEPAPSSSSSRHPRSTTTPPPPPPPPPSGPISPISSFLSSHYSGMIHQAKSHLLSSLSSAGRGSRSPSRDAVRKDVSSLSLLPKREEKGARESPVRLPFYSREPVPPCPACTSSTSSTLEEKKKEDQQTTSSTPHPQRREDTVGGTVQAMAGLASTVLRSSLSSFHLPPPSIPAVFAPPLTEPWPTQNDGPPSSEEEKNANTSTVISEASPQAGTVPCIPTETLHRTEETRRRKPVEGEDTSAMKSSCFPTTAYSSELSQRYHLQTPVGTGAASSVSHARGTSGTWSREALPPPSREAPIPPAVMHSTRGAKEEGEASARARMHNTTPSRSPPLTAITYTPSSSLPTTTMLTTTTTPSATRTTITSTSNSGSHWSSDWGGTTSWDRLLNGLWPQLRHSALPSFIVPERERALTGNEAKRGEEREKSSHRRATRGEREGPIERLEEGGEGTLERVPSRASLPRRSPLRSSSRSSSSTTSFFDSAEEVSLRGRRPAHNKEAPRATQGEKRSTLRGSSGTVSTYFSSTSSSSMLSSSFPTRLTWNSTDQRYYPVLRPSFPTHRAKPVYSLQEKSVEEEEEETDEEEEGEALRTPILQVGRTQGGEVPHGIDASDITVDEHWKRSPPYTATTSRPSHAVSSSSSSSPQEEKKNTTEEKAKHTTHRRTKHPEEVVKAKALQYHDPYAAHDVPPPSSPPYYFSLHPPPFLSSSRSSTSSTSSSFPSLTQLDKIMPVLPPSSHLVPPLYFSSASSSRSSSSSSRSPSPFPFPMSSTNGMATKGHAAGWSVPPPFPLFPGMMPKHWKKDEERMKKEMEKTRKQKKAGSEKQGTRGRSSNAVPLSSMYASMWRSWWKYCSRQSPPSTRLASHATSERSSTSATPSSYFSLYSASALLPKKKRRRAAGEEEEEEGTRHTMPHQEGMPFRGLSSLPFPSPRFPYEYHEESGDRASGEEEEAVPPPSFFPSSSFSHPEEEEAVIVEPPQDILFHDLAQPVEALGRTTEKDLEGAHKKGQQMELESKERTGSSRREDGVRNVLYETSRQHSSITPSKREDGEDEIEGEGEKGKKSRELGTTLQVRDEIVALQTEEVDDRISHTLLPFSHAFSQEDEDTDETKRDSVFSEVHSTTTTTRSSTSTARSTSFSLPDPKPIAVASSPFLSCHSGAEGVAQTKRNEMGHTSEEEEKEEEEGDDSNASSPSSVRTTSDGRRPSPRRYDKASPTSSFSTSSSSSLSELHEAGHAAPTLLAAHFREDERESDEEEEEGEDNEEEDI